MKISWNIVLILILISVIFVEAKKGRKHRHKNDRNNHRDKNNRNRRRDKGRTADVEYVLPSSGQRVRLKSSLDFNITAGNVEVYLRNQWGMLCDDEWGRQDANVVCKQLGFTNGASSFTSDSTFGVGNWNTSDILMDDVRCHGDESSILSCSYEYPSNCMPNEGAGVVCYPNSGCPDNWVAGPYGCYILPNGTTTQKKFAENKCSSLGGHLVNIETEAENHFLSNAFAKVIQGPVITGAVKSGTRWLWKRVERSQTSSTAQSFDRLLDQFGLRGKRSVADWTRKPPRRPSPRRPKPPRQPPNSGRNGQTSSSVERIVQTSIRYFKWFPGWLPGNKNAEPNGKKHDKCIYLMNTIVHPDKSQGAVRVDYLYWADNHCKRSKKRLVNGFQYLCEKPRTVTDTTGQNGAGPVEECYRDKGETYRGTHSSTENRTPCVSWTLGNKYTPSNYPDKNLAGHNHCRNPDGDRKPWCYVDSKGKFGFCPVPECTTDEVAITTKPAGSRTTARPTTTTTAPAPESECPDNKFYCTGSNLCISRQWQCDIEPDCTTGEDEDGCDYKILQFKVTPRRKFWSQSVIKESFVGVSNETCAKFCLAKETYVCRSFAFTKSTRQCDLSDANIQLPGTITWSMEGAVYQLLSQTVDCSRQAGMFKCGNGRCIVETNVCNSEDNCGDLTDELNCGTPDPVEVRLVDGDEHSGRVEIKYMGEWGLVCDDHWDDKDAAVICGMLGYTRDEAKSTGLSKYGSGTGNFLLDEVACTGHEESIEECAHPGWKVHNCRSFEVAGVQCRAQKSCTEEEYTCGNTNCIPASSVCDGTCHCNPDTCEDENGNTEHNCKSAKLELINGTKGLSGRIEITCNGLRGTVCDDSWDNVDAKVLCGMMGFKYGEAVTGGYFGRGTGPIWLDDFNCRGTETSISDCDRGGWGVHDCSHDEDAGVVCSHEPPATPTPEPDKVEIELVGGSQNGQDGSPIDGRVEIIRNGERGTICDDNWDNNDATVVCRKFGYSRGIAKIDGHFGPGSSSLPILLDEVDCSGTETSLAQCKHAGWGVNNCGHGEDAGVVCHNDQAGGDNQGQNNNPSTVPCGRRPLETNSRKKREEPFEDEAVLEPPKFERIIGGFTASQGFYPWQVGIRRLVQGSVYSHWCGGTILGEFWILSAAHCFQDLQKSHIVVRAGDHDNKRDDTYEQQFEVEQLINHARYDGNTYNYDIALIKIKPKDGGGIKFSDHVQPACLPEETTEYIADTKCHISGWGKTAHGYQNMLKSAKVPILSDSTCKRLYKDVTPNMVCAGYLAGGIDSCAGDSGGPLVCDVNGRYTVMGATSWGAGCAEANAPGVYTRVTAFIPWIKSNIQKYS